MDIKSLLKNHAYQNIPLWYDQAYELGCQAIAVCEKDADSVVRHQTVSTLSALHNKATYAHVGDGVSTPLNAAEQIAGICAAVFHEDIAKSEFGFVRPNVPLVMDNCGMGGDLIVTANISSLAALIASAAGINMCKHGSQANADKGRHGSSDFIKICGIDPYMSRPDVERLVETAHFGYTDALDTRFKQIHLQTHLYADMPHMNDIIGPITNPIDPALMSRRVIGVNHLIPTHIVAEAYALLNKRGVTNMEHLIAVRGFAETSSNIGMDEFSICHGGTEMTVLYDGQISTTRVFADMFGIDSVHHSEITPPQGVSKGDFSLQILHGEIAGPALEMVLANAALLFVLNSSTKLDFRSAYELARDTFASGKVPDVITTVQLMLEEV